MSTVSVLILGSDSQRRERLREWLGRERSAHIVGELADVQSLHLVSYLAPDVVLFDGASPAWNPLVVLPWLKAQPHAPQTLALLTGASEAERRLVLELGAAASATLSAPELARAWSRLLTHVPAAARLPSPPRVAPQMHSAPLQSAL